MNSLSARPIVLIPCDYRMMRAMPFHVAGDKYVRAVSDGAGAQPLLLPAIGAALDFDTVLGLADGVLLTGSPSNVAPSRYGGAPLRDPGTLDERRDETTFTLIARALSSGVPLLAICRGFQELNVALGGSLHQHLEELPGRLDHRDRPEDPLDVQYGPAHRIDIVRGGLLERWTGAQTAIVNSLHSQGIDRLAASLNAEAHAPDGTIEAVSVKNAESFAFGTQWHPEWEFWKNSISQAILRSFGAAIRKRAENKD